MMDSGFIVLMIVVAVIAVGSRILWWVFAARAIGRQRKQFEQQMRALHRQVQGAQGGGAQMFGNPQLMNQWLQMQQMYGSMGAQDQMRYSESMASMKAEAASHGLFLD